MEYHPAVPLRGCAGAVGELEIDAFRHHSPTLPVLERDLLAHTVGDLIGDLIDDQRPPRIPQASDLLDHDEPPSTGHDQHGADRERPAGEP